MSDPMRYVTFRDIDGLWYISGWDVAGFNSDGQASNKKLFTPDEAQVVLEYMRAHPRHECGPDEGFYQVRVVEATEDDILTWKGPSTTLTEYLCEGNTKEDLVKVLWEMITPFQRRELEAEAEQVKFLMEQE
jgi:hypothetical protein